MKIKNIIYNEMLFKLFFYNENFPVQTKEAIIILDE